MKQTTNYSAGHTAEKLAADYLSRRGFKVLELNWKTKYCEIDIVAQKKKTMYLVEVKSRKNAAHGSGLEYITPKKLQQMSFAAEYWAAANRWDGEFQLAALGITGSEITFTEEIWP